MCVFMIILHIVSLAVGNNFTPRIGCTNFCCAFRTQSYCTYYRWIWFSCPLIWDKCSISCAVLNDTGWCLELVRVPVKCRNCEWPVSQLAVIAALRVSDVHVEWSKQGQFLQEFLSLLILTFSKVGHIFCENNKCVQGSAINYSIKEPHWPTVCFSCRGVQAAHLNMTVHTTISWL